LTTAAALGFRWVRTMNLTVWACIPGRMHGPRATAAAVTRAIPFSRRPPGPGLMDSEYKQYNQKNSPACGERKIEACQRFDDPLNAAAIAASPRSSEQRLANSYPLMFPHKCSTGFNFGA
jgi:hypothetical protein